MLIKITNYCSMGCSHCMEDSTVAGAHMTSEIFDKALACARRVEEKGWAAGYPPWIGISGGEATEHPDVLEYIQRVYDHKMVPLLITNGLWLDDPEMRKAILRPEWSDLFIQVSNDPAFYPRSPKTRVQDRRIAYIDKIPRLIPLGRMSAKKAAGLGMPTLQFPTSFNLRSLTRHHNDIGLAVASIRLRGLVTQAGFCVPTIDSAGNFIAGETSNCFRIGTVDSSNVELTRAVIAMGACNRCGLEDNLDQAHRRAIGLSRLYAGNE